MVEIVDEARLRRCIGEDMHASEQRLVAGDVASPSLDAGAVQHHMYLFHTGAIRTASTVNVEMTPHYGATILMALDSAPLTVCVEGRSYRGYVMAIQPGRQYRVDAIGSKYCLVRLNPLHPQFRQFAAIHQPGVIAIGQSMLAPLLPAMRVACQGALAPIPGEQLLAGIVAAVARDLPSIPPVDPRIPRVLCLLRANPNCTVGELSSEFGISASRMSHLFRASVGLPIQTYLRWQRLHCATELITSDMSFTDIAHAVGYTDVSHFGREVREFAGMSLSKLFRSAETKIFNWRAGSMASMYPVSTELKRDIDRRDTMDLSVQYSIWREDHRQSQELRWDRHR